MGDVPRFDDKTIFGAHISRSARVGGYPTRHEAPGYHVAGTHRTAEPDVVIVEPIPDGDGGFGTGHTSAEKRVLVQVKQQDPGSLKKQAADEAEQLSESLRDHPMDFVVFADETARRAPDLTDEQRELNLRVFRIQVETELLARRQNLSTHKCGQVVLRCLDGWAAILPVRINNEEVGDYIEDINRRVQSGQIWQVYLRLAAAIFWTGIHAVGDLLQSLGKRTPG